MDDTTAEDWYVCPGDILGSSTQFISGEGTYVDGEEIRSLLLGICCKEDIVEETSQPVENNPNQNKKQRVKVIRKGESTVVPKQGDIVVGRVLRVTPKLAQVQIICIGDTFIKRYFEGVIRISDVRTMDIDKIQMYECFKAGDVVRARILSFGDVRSYFLSTAEDALGVVEAKGNFGTALVSKNQSEMECPETQSVERRKVALVQ